MNAIARIAPGAAAEQEALSGFRELGSAQAKEELGALLTEIRGLGETRAGRVALIVTKDAKGEQHLSAVEARLARAQQTKVGMKALRILLDRVGDNLKTSRERGELPTGRMDLESLLMRYVKGPGALDRAAATEKNRLAKGQVNPIAMMALGHTKAPWLAGSVRKVMEGMRAELPSEREAAKAQFADDLGKIPAGGEALDDFTVACLVMRALDAVPASKAPGDPSREERLIAALPASVALRWLTALDSGHLGAPDPSLRDMLVAHIDNLLTQWEQGPVHQPGADALLQTLKSIPEDRQAIYAAMLEKTTAIAGAAADARGTRPGDAAAGTADVAVAPELAAAFEVLIAEEPARVTDERPAVPVTASRRSAVGRAPDSTEHADPIARVVDGDDAVSRAEPQDAPPLAASPRVRSTARPSAGTPAVEPEALTLEQEQLSHEPLEAALTTVRATAAKQFNRSKPDAQAVAVHLSTQLDEREAQSLAVASAARKPAVVRRLSTPNRELHDAILSTMLSRPLNTSGTAALKRFQSALSWNPLRVTPTGPTPARSSRLKQMFGMGASRSMTAKPVGGAEPSPTATSVWTMRERSWQQARAELLTPGSTRSYEVAQPTSAARRDSAAPAADAYRVTPAVRNAHVASHLVVAQIRATSSDSRGLESIATRDTRALMPMGWHADLAEGVERLPATASRRDIQSIRESVKAQVTVDAEALEAAALWLTKSAAERRGRGPDPAALAIAFARQLAFLSEATRSRPLQGWLGLPGGQVNMVLLAMIATLVRVHQQIKLDRWDLGPVADSEPKVTSKRAANTVAGAEAARRQARRSPAVDALTGAINEVDGDIEALQRSAVEALEGQGDGLTGATAR